MKVSTVFAWTLAASVTITAIDYLPSAVYAWILKPVATASASDEFECANCNIILINIDLMRFDHVGVFNPKSELTPNIDRFFESGIQFFDAISASGATYLSATATTTATEAMLNSHDFGVLSHKRPGGGSWRLLAAIAEEGRLLIDRIPSIAQTLSNEGYTTIGMNDWIHSGPEVYLDRGFQHYHQTPLQGSTMDSQIDVALSLLEKNRQQPFLFYMHSNTLHFNFYFPTDYRLEDSGLSSRMMPYTTQKNGSYVIRARAPGVRLEDAWKAYSEQLRYVDATLQRLFDYIERRHSKNTIVVLYSHHGIGSRIRKKLGVGLPYQEFVHVPLLIRHPEISKAIRIGTMVSLVDLPVTLYQMIKIDPPQELITYTLTPLLKGISYPRKFTFTRDFQHESIRQGHWKLIYKGGIPAELYNLEEDPGETNNLYDATLEVVQRLSAGMYQERLRQSAYHKRLEASLE